MLDLSLSRDSPCLELLLAALGGLAQHPRVWRKLQAVAKIEARLGLSQTNLCKTSPMQLVMIAKASVGIMYII